MAAEFAWLLAACGGEGDVPSLLALARTQEAAGNFRIAATAYDLAFGLEPGNTEIVQAREALLDQLAVEEGGIRFRYVPAGTFLMGSETGDADEQPVHPVELSEYWIAETPLNWTGYCRLMGWRPPPRMLPLPLAPPEDADPEAQRRRSRIYVANMIRLQYCEDATLRAARNWHAHIPQEEWERQSGRAGTRVPEGYGKVEREDPQRPYTYTEKPVVGVPLQAVQELCARISTAEVVYRLPTEAEWEKAARGGLIGCRYPWGDEPASPDRCDCNRFEQFAIQSMRCFPPNGYGLYAMSGCVWEWTQDWYDAEYYAQSPCINPTGAPMGEEKVLRGGSWADCADAVTVSFRMSLKPEAGRTPSIGFRLCRVERQPTTR